MAQEGETEDSYYNNVSVSSNILNNLVVSVSVNLSSQEMPEVPDVSILHCGKLAHHKMGIKVELYCSNSH